MSLKFKRNYSMILLLIAILCFLTFVVGDQPIVAYTFKAERQQTAQAATIKVTRLVGLSTLQTAGAVSQIAHANAAFDVEAEVDKGK